MTKKELAKLYHLNRGIEQDKQQLQALEAAAMGTTPCITGLPHVSGKADKTALAGEIADIRAEIGEKVRLSIIEYAHLHRYASTLGDSLVRQIVILRHVDGCTWKQVAMHVGGDNTADSVKMVYHRFFNK